jgi:thiosulfate/3-mercaptopyruvate sulfurtransferase
VNVLIDVDELAARLDSGSPPVVLDVRWALGDPRGHDHYLAGHVPGAVYVDLETELAGPPSPQEGRHPLPTIENLQAAARRWGVRDDSSVVAYDDVGGTSAARVWWLLRWAGVADVRLLDGALGAWRANGYPVEGGVVRPAAGDVTLRPGAMPVIDADEAADLARSGTLLDARAAERYRGEIEPVDPVAGHIPGAVSAATTDNLDRHGRFLAPELLRERFTALGVDQTAPVGVYCGSGVTATHEVAALAIVGIDAALYPGSWSQWCNDPSRPVSTGP